MTKGKITVFRIRYCAALLGCLLSATAAPALAEADAGSYLAARQASFGNDFESAATFFSDSLVADPTNPGLLESAMTAFTSQGMMDRAIPLADTMVAEGIDSQLAHLLQDMNAAQTGNWDAVFSALEEGRTVGPLVDGVMQAWAYVGLGQMSKALETFDTVVETAGLAPFGLYHKALALATVGDFEGADKILSLAGTGSLRLDRRGVIAHAQILSQLGRNADALALIDSQFEPANDPGMTALRERLTGDEAVPYDIVRTPVEGVAELYFQVAQAVISDAPENYTLLYTRAANYLAPDNTEALLVTASLLDNLGRFQLANETYAQVTSDNPSYLAAELGRAEALRKDGRSDVAIEVLTALIRSFPTLPQIPAALGDVLRGTEDIKGANAAYSTALDLYRDDDPAKWFVHYVRAITYHSLDQWPEAEADFRAALALRPNQPQVLNYLGYSLVERGEKMDEALAMIETAVAGQPDNGAIVDSLGWVLFQLGRYDEAVVHLENAASLEPVDPVVNDHLGDVFWAVGREIEAHFQWSRALSFDPTEEEAARIRRKLEIGLDAVLAEEGAEPLRVARGDR